MQVVRVPHDVDALAVSLAARTAVAERQQLVRLDTAYRTFSQAAAAPCAPQQEARLRAHIATYFQHPSAVAPPEAPPMATPHAAPPPAAASSSAAAGAQEGIPVAEERVGAAAEGANNSAPDPSEAVSGEGAVGLAGLPIRTGHSSLALDTRELMAYARRQNMVHPPSLTFCTGC